MKKDSKQALIEGVVGMIEVRYSSGVENLGFKKLVVLNHPHPLHGGTMNNKVVTTMERAFQQLGYITVAYNFRGVGESGGCYDHGVGEQDDLCVVLAWAKQTFQVAEVTLAGFSFGSYVALRAQAKVQTVLNIEAMCTVAPPVGLYDFSDIGGGEFSWVLIQGGQDEVVSATEILNWAVTLENSPDVYWRAKAGHFFHGELIWLKKLILLLY